MPALETKSAFPPGPGPAPDRSSGPRLQPSPVAPPVAHVAGDAASSAALATLAEEMRSAREGGRMVQELPLDAIDADHLVRDRLVADDAEMAALVESLRARGQQTPIEVVDLGGGRFGLISGWRRLTALRRLAEAGEGKATVLALLRRPDSAAEAYLAMVEENEIRVGLSYYERARIAARAADMGVYTDENAALAGLFSSASKAKRSKIGSFLRLYRALDDRLRFPAAIPERLGLALLKRLEGDADFAAKLRDRLRKTPPQSAEEELAALERALGGESPRGRGKGPESAEGASAARSEAASAVPKAGGAPTGVRFARRHNRITLTGPGVTDDFAAALQAWLVEQGH